MMSNTAKRLSVIILCFCILIGDARAFAEEGFIAEEQEKNVELWNEYLDEDYGDDFYDELDGHDERSGKEEIEEPQILNDEQAVAKDKANLSIGFVHCISRDLKLPTEGMNGTTITWQSSHPDLMSHDGKYTKPKKITDVTLTATIKRGAAIDKKVFNLTLNDRTMYEVVKDYADTMIKYGRDTRDFSVEDYKRVTQTYDTGSSMGTGPMDTPTFNMAGRSLTPKGRSGLFYSLIDRETLQYPAYYVKDWPRMAYNSDERGSGCNVGYDYWLYNILYDLSLLTGDKRYEQIADESLYFFITYCQNPDAGTLAWGLHTVYDPVTGTVNTTNQYATTLKEQDTWTSYTEPGPGDKEAMMTPFFINKLYSLNPRAMDNHMMSWWEATVSDKKFFTFGRHTDWEGKGNAHGGYLSMTDPILYAFAWGYHYSGNAEYLEAIDSFLSMIERHCSMNDSFLYSQDYHGSNNRGRRVWSYDMQLAAEVCLNVMPLLPDSMHERLQRFIDSVLENTLGYDEKQGFYRMHMLRTGQVTNYKSLDSGIISLWRSLDEDNEYKKKLDEWVLHWMNKNEFYSLETKLSDVDYYPRTIADEMKVHIDCYLETGDEKFLDRALEYADFAIYDFWELESLLPSMTHAQKKYYESSWGSVEVVGAIWQAYFLDKERKTGINPINEAWDEAGYVTRNIFNLENETEFLSSTKNKKGGNAE